ncbi:hypothetical protein M0N77_06040 [Psychrobacter sp. AH5]|uniref:hypothetical protein n=1 Tax=Psychrobacter sp. AH5 TaxID=2937433 RepID=UPI00333FB53F
MEVTNVMGASLFIGTSIFVYIVAFILVLVFFGYLTYRVSPKGKARREAKRNKRH